MDVSLLKERLDICNIFTSNSGRKEYNKTVFSMLMQQSFTAGNEWVLVKLGCRLSFIGITTPRVAKALSF